MYSSHLTGTQLLSSLRHLFQLIVQRKILPNKGSHKLWQNYILSLLYIVVLLVPSYFQDLIMYDQYIAQYFLPSFFSPLKIYVIVSINNNRTSNNLFNNMMTEPLERMIV